ncbi:MAG: hypothetical protein ACEPO2_09060 [Pelagibaca sp.]
MISSKPTARIIGIPVLLGLLSTPIPASTPEVGRADIETDLATRSVEVLYPRYAQVGGDDIGGGDNESSDSERNARAPSGPPVTASTAQTTQFVNRLEDSEQICDVMDDEYRISCFAVTYRQLAEEIPANGDYDEARDVLLETARKLDNIVRSNIDREKPALTARIRNNSGQSQPTPPMRAVQAPRAAELNRQASDVLAEAETVLLRSASSDATRAIHYQRIAAAVGSNKVLLRST